MAAPCAGATARRMVGIDPALLNTQEIEYELYIRGVTHTRREHGDLVELLSRKIHQDGLVGRVNSLRRQDELDSITSLEAELRMLVQEARLSGIFHVEPSRLGVAFAHCAFRLRRIIFLTRGDVFRRLSELAGYLTALRGRMRVLFPTYDFPTLPEAERREEEELVELTGRLRVGGASDCRGEDPVRSGGEERSASRRSEVRSPRRRELSGGRRSGVDSRSDVREPTRTEGAAPVLSGTVSEEESRRSCAGSQRRRAKRARGGRRPQKRGGRRRRDSRSTTESDSTESGSASDDADSPDDHRARRGRNPVPSWKLRFSGASIDDVTQFLEGVERMVCAEDVTDDELMRGIGNLLSGPALAWYRTTPHSIRNWKNFKKYIREAFLPGDNDDLLLDRIRKTRQKDDENFEVFASRMEDMFMRLDEPLSEKRKVNIVMKNMHLYYSSKIPAARIDSMASLRRECRVWESTKLDNIRKEKEREKCDRGRMEREKEDRQAGRYERARRPPDLHAVEKPVGENEEHVRECQQNVGLGEWESPSFEAITAGAGRRNNPFKGGAEDRSCWRCGDPGHLSMRCETEIFCVSCGQRDVVAERCPKCAPLRYRGNWLPQPGMMNPFCPAPLVTSFPNGTWNWGTGVPLPAPAPPMELFPPPTNLPPPIRPREVSHPLSQRPPGPAETSAPRRRGPGNGPPNPQ